MTKIRLFGNLMNRIAEASPQVEVKVGDGATICMYSDRKAATVIKVGKNAIVVQEDRAIRTDSNGMSDAQSYRYERDPHGRVFTFTLRKNGRFVEEGEAMGRGNGLVTGERCHYHDYSF